MRKAFWITLVFTVLTSLLLFPLGKSAWCLGLWVGSLWGMANAWCLNLVLQTALSRQRHGWRLALLLVVKLAGLYGLAIWFLVGLRLSPLAWIGGFTLSLIGLGISALPSLRTLLRVEEAKG